MHFISDFTACLILASVDTLNLYFANLRCVAYRKLKRKKVPDPNDKAARSLSRLEPKKTNTSAPTGDTVPHVCEAWNPAHAGSTDNAVHIH